VVPHFDGVFYIDSDIDPVAGSSSPSTSNG